MKDAAPKTPHESAVFFCIFNAVSRREKFEKTLFPENQFFHARGDISEMQRNSFMDWYDSNTEA